MTTTDKHEEGQPEAAINYEGTNGYIAEKMDMIAVAHERVNQIHAEMRTLNQELGVLQNDVYGWQCDIQRIQQP